MPKVVDSRGPTGLRSYKLEWKGYDSSEVIWVPSGWLNGCESLVGGFCPPRVLTPEGPTPGL